MATEYGGTESPNTVQPKGADVLTASERLRLVYLTGQEEDSKAKENRKAWTGEAT